MKIAAASVCNQGGSSKSIDYTARAARACIEGSTLSDHEIGLLLNIGVYRQSNIHEPAMAALIQGALGLNSDPVKLQASASPRGTLALDVLNGNCGFWSALRIASSFAQNGTARAVLVVGSDVHPSGAAEGDFPYDDLGAAVLLTESADGSGFHDVVHKVSDEELVGSRSYIDITQAHGSRGSVDFEVDRDYADRLCDFALAGVAEYVRAHAVDLKALKYVIVGSDRAALVPMLRDLLGLRPEQLLDVEARFGRPFSAFPMAGYALAEERGLEPGDQLLFVSAGAGLSLACSTYRV